MLVVQEFVTADGFAADEDGAYGFGGVIADWSPLEPDQAELIDRTGMLVLGRTTYELFIRFWPTADHPLAERINSTPKTVVSRSLTAAPWGDWPEPAIGAGPLPELIERLGDAAAPRDLLVWGSLALTRCLIDEGLVDQIRLIVCPVAIGAGVGVFPTGSACRELRRAEVTSYPNGAVEVTYAFRR